MGTTVDSLKNLGLKVNGSEPTSKYVNNIINEIADEYSPTEAGMSNPMSAAGDMIIGGTSGAPAKLTKGTDNQVLTMVSGAPAWAAAQGGSGTKLYKHTFTAPYVMQEMEEGDLPTYVISAESAPITTAAIAKSVLMDKFVSASVLAYGLQASVLGFQEFTDNTTAVTFDAAVWLNDDTGSIKECTVELAYTADVVTEL